jgi:trehalose 6-phosphate synthase/phosphatase
MARLILISNRLPFSIDTTGDTISIRQSSGGLVSAIKSYLEKTKDSDGAFSDKVWVGSLDVPESLWEQAKTESNNKTDFEVQPVFLEKEVYEGYYNGLSNSTIWPLFHYFPSLTQYKREYFQAYTAVNQSFADKIKEIYQPGDVIWVHDYQLMLLPQLLRDVLPEATIGFFLHIPFPSYEIFRLLPSPWKTALLKGLMGADLIGFHTHDYVQHFIQSAKMVLRVENSFNTIQFGERIIKVDLFPIGIDFQKFRDAITNDLVANISAKLEKTFFQQKIIFSVDRLDYTKGLNYRLNGFEEFLDTYPEWHEKIIFILNIIPSRDVIQAYVERRREIEERVSAINGKYSSLQWQPVIYRYNHLEFDELCALYQSADVALITPLRDGMNLVAKEYVASCIDKGVLILSELTGAASELNEAILVNPTDSSEVAESINTALNMPLVDQRSRLSFMQRRLAEYNVVKWINDFLEVLNNIKEEQEKQRVLMLSPASVDQILEKYRSSDKRCILLDYDGTLAPYQKLPSLAVPGTELLVMLQELSSDPKNEVVIISGRDADTLGKWMGDLPVTLVAEHGACIRYHGEEWEQQVSHPPDWKNEIRPLMELFVSRCVGSFIEEKKNTLAWHYRNTHPDLGFIRSRELRNSLLQLITNTPLQVIDGNKVLEVRLIGIDKGSSAQKLVKHFKPDFTLCVGDDATDEDMFRALREVGHTIKIGAGNTAANYTLPSQLQVLPLLRRFVIKSGKEYTS